MKARDLEVAVISDLHLATYACNPKKVMKYLKSIRPQKLVLNGDFIDSWRFSRNYFPKSHLKIVRYILKMMEKGVEVFYITGNHDDFLRKFSPVDIGNLKIVNQLVLNLDGKKTWIFHGDIFDNSIVHTLWLAKIGALGKGLITGFNRLINILLRIAGKGEILLYKNIRKQLTRKRSELSVLESRILNNSIAMGYDTVVCGHTHIPKIQRVEAGLNTACYINSGDWVEHFTAAEYYDKEWHLYYLPDTEEENQTDDVDIPEGRQLYQQLIKEFAFLNCY